MASRVMLVGLSLTRRLGGETEVAKITVSEKSLRLVMVRLDVAEEFSFIEIPVGLAVITKADVALVVKVAVCRISGIGVSDPLEMDTHVPSLTLVPVQLAW